MARTMQKVDAVMVGGGWTGILMGKELAAAGLKVAVLERGAKRATVPDFQSGHMHDELDVSVRYYATMQDLSLETYTFRNTAEQTALPMRRMGAFLPGTGLGGAGVHWSGAYYRYDEEEWQLRSNYTKKYGAGIFDEELTAQDWPLGYADLEPHYDRFEYLCGISGRGGNIDGVKQPGGNPFEAPRKRDYPNPPMKVAHASAIFSKAAYEMGYHPFIQASANLSRPYTNTEGIALGACNYCGFCSNYGCEHYAKSNPITCVLPTALKLPGFQLRTGSQVVRVNMTDDRKHATGVTYIDLATKEVVEQPAEMVFLCSFAINNVRLMLLSGIGQPYDAREGKGVVGRNFTHQTTSAISMFFPEGTRINPFMGAGALAVTIDDFTNDHFDHGPHRFVGGAYIQVQVVGGAPIKYHPTPKGTPSWGQGWKDAVRTYYNRAAQITLSGSSLPRRGTVLDLDPSYKDAYGQPLLRITHDFPDNDIRMSAFATAKAEEIAHRMGASIVEAQPRKGPYNIVPYQTTHLAGGAAMGADPNTSAVNRYCQSWDAPNVFVMGSTVFPQNSAYNPTGTVGALAYWTAQAVKDQYLKAPGQPLVRS